MAVFCHTDGTELFRASRSHGCQGLQYLYGPTDTWHRGTWIFDLILETCHAFVLIFVFFLDKNLVVF